MDSSQPEPPPALPETELRERLETLERKVRFQEAVLSRISDMVVAVDADDRVTLTNEEAGRRLGFDPDDAVGRPVRELYDFELPAGVTLEQIFDSLERHGRWRGELTLVTNDGARVPVESNVVTLEADGRPGRVAVMRDISERKEAERRLFESRERLRVALESIPLTAAVVDHDFRYRWVYNTAVRFPTDDVVGRRVDEVLAPEDAAKVLRIKEQALEEERRIEADLEMELQGERHVYHVVAEPYRDPDGTVTGVMTAALDITDRKKMEEDLRTAKEAAEAANRSKGAFLASMSHELRTPLNAIVGYADLLDEGVPAPIPEASGQHVERIRISARHLLHLIEEILEYTRMEAAPEKADFTVVELDDLVGEVRAVIEPLTSQKGLQLAVDTMDAPDRLRTDPRKLRQILLNLLGNAAKYTKKGGVTLRISKTASDIQFHVVDTGPGLDPENRDRIFEPFWRCDVPGQEETFPGGGTGLGLTISLRYARLMGGDIGVRSTPGRGSTFVLHLPLEPPEA